MTKCATFGSCPEPAAQTNRPEPRPAAPRPAPNSDPDNWSTGSAASVRRQCGPVSRSTSSRAAPVAPSPERRRGWREPARATSADLALREVLSRLARRLRIEVAVEVRAQNLFRTMLCQISPFHFCHREEESGRWKIQVRTLPFPLSTSPTDFFILTSAFGRRTLLSSHPMPSSRYGDSSRLRNARPGGAATCWRRRNPSILPISSCFNPWMS